MMLPQAMILSQYGPPSSQHSQDRLGDTPKAVEAAVEEEGGV